MKGFGFGCRVSVPEERPGHRARWPCRSTCRAPAVRPLTVKSCFEARAPRLLRIWGRYQAGNQAENSEDASKSFSKLLYHRGSRRNCFQCSSEHATPRMKGRVKRLRRPPSAREERFRFSGFGLQNSYFGFRVSGFGFRVPSSELRI